MVLLQTYQYKISAWPRMLHNAISGTGDSPDLVHLCLALRCGFGRSRSLGPFPKRGEHRRLSFLDRKVDHSSDSIFVRCWSRRYNTRCGGSFVHSCFTHVFLHLSISKGASCAPVTAVVLVRNSDRSARRSKSLEDNDPTKTASLLFI